MLTRQIYRQAAKLRFLLTSAIRVNRTWHDVIISSSKLQRALFLRSPSFPVNAENEPRFNALLLSVFPKLFRPSSNSVSWYEVKGICNAVMHPNATWRRMYPMLPPVRRVPVIVTIYLGEGVLEKSYGEIKISQEGLTMSDLYDSETALARAGCTQYAVGWYTEPRNVQEELPSFR